MHYESANLETLSAAPQSRPLCVDLDGTLIRGDLLYESLFETVRRHPAIVFILPLWLFRGKAYLKRQLAERCFVSAALLPYHVGLLEWLSAERRLGRRIILCTSADDLLARRVAEHLQIFEEVIASDGTSNLSGIGKRNVLLERFGVRGFDYVGNSKADLAVWSESNAAILVNASSKVLNNALAIAPIARVFPRPSSIRGLFRAMRFHQWIKNFLIFIPLVTSHLLFEGHLFVRALMMLAGFCLCASGAYVLNDLLDIEADRQHPIKRSRPFAAGSCSVGLGLLLVPLMTLGGFAIVMPLGTPSVLILGSYLSGALFYSLYLKRKPLLDVFALSVLYSLRVGAGQSPLASCILRGFSHFARSCFSA